MDKSENNRSIPIRSGIDRRNFLRNGTALGGALALSACTGAAVRAPTVALPKNAGTLQSQRALRELGATLTQISRSYLVPERGFTESADVVEGQRFLMHLLSAGSDFYLEGDPARPWFISMVSPIRKFLGDNPDARYFFAPIHGDRFYRIRGRRQGNEYISYTVHTGGHDGNWNGPGISHINHTDIEFSANGEYEIVLGPSRRGKNWLKSDASAVYVVNRHYYEHADSAAGDHRLHPTLSIEALDPLPPPPQRLSDEQTAERLRNLANFLRVSTIDLPPPTPQTVPAWWSLTPNQMGAIARFGDNQDDIGLGAIDNSYTAGPYLLGPGQGLLMEGRLPRCFFANVVLWNRFLQTDDYRYRQVSLNRKQMKLRSGNRYRILVSPENPGVHNWLDTAGRSGGIIQWRFLLAQGNIERPRCRLIDLADASSLAD